MRDNECIAYFEKDAGGIPKIKFYMCFVDLEKVFD